MQSVQLVGIKLANLRTKLTLSISKCKGYRSVRSATKSKSVKEFSGAEKQSKRFVT